MTMTLLRPIFYIGFIGANYYIYTMVQHFKNQPDCGCATGWQPENLILLSQLSMLLGSVNLLLPLNKTLYRIPLISTIFSVGLLLVVFVELFTLTRFVRALKIREDCKGPKCIPGDYDVLIDMASTWSISMVGILSLGTSVGLLYL